MAGSLSNRFEKLAEQFLDRHAKEADEEEWDDEELENQIRSFLSNQGIDDAWMDEAIEIVREYWEDNR